MQYYRPRLPPSERSNPIFLLVDGHKSRINYSAAAILKIFNIDLLVFPGHCSHVIQPFDVAVASPLKAAYKSELLRYNIDKTFLIIKIILRSAKEIRIMVLESLLRVMEIAFTVSNITSEFEKSGIAPLDRNIPLDNQFTMNDSIFGCKENPINNYWLNEDIDSLKSLFLLDKKKEVSNDDIPNLNTVKDLDNLTSK